MLWGCTVREAIGRCDAPEFAEWKAWWEIEPFGAWRDDFRMATIAMTVANSQGAKTMMKDFMPDFKPRQRQTSNEQMGKQLSTIFGSRKRKPQ